MLWASENNHKNTHVSRPRHCAVEWEYRVGSGPRTKMISDLARGVAFYMGTFQGHQIQDFPKGPPRNADRRSNWSGRRNRGRNVLQMLPPYALRVAYIRQ